MSLPDSFYFAQEKELELLANKRVKEFLALLEKARIQLHDVLMDTDSSNSALIATANRMETIARELARELKAQGLPVQSLTELAANHQTSAVQALLEKPAIVVNWNQLSVDTLIRYSEAELLKVTTITSVVELNRLKSEMFSRIAMQGQNPQQVAKALTGINGSFKKPYGVIENILRTETAAIYNAQSVGSIEQINTRYGQKLEKKILEKIDPKRNHPISMVLNGQQQPIGKPFKAKVSEVNAAAKRIKKSSTGIFWPQKNGYYVGQNLPAHYRERGIVIAAVAIS